MNQKTTAFDYEVIANRMRNRAMSGSFHGGTTVAERVYIQHCRTIANGATLIFTRDEGHHTSGWFKNPDYERCWHLSTSPAPARIWTPGTRDLDKAEINAWLRAFFHDDISKLWAETPKSPQGKRDGVMHWRMFADPAWEPIVPRGEVYSRELTEAGWKTSTEMGIEIVSVLEPG